jgi:hypothetical protein
MENANYARRVINHWSKPTPWTRRVVNVEAAEEIRAADNFYDIIPQRERVARTLATQKVCGFSPCHGGRFWALIAVAARSLRVDVYHLTRGARHRSWN